MFGTKFAQKKGISSLIQEKWTSRLIQHPPIIAIGIKHTNLIFGLNLSKTGIPGLKQKQKTSLPDSTYSY